MARLNWDKGRTMVQRRGLLKASLSTLLSGVIVAVISILRYKNGTVEEYELWLYGLCIVLSLAAIILTLSSLRELLNSDAPSKQIRNEGRS